MKLYKVQFSVGDKSPVRSSWEINDIVLSDLNLITGKNAVGKSRSVNIIDNLAKIINLKLPILQDGHWILEFKKGKKIFKYILNIVDNKAIEEKIYIDDELKLSRNGKGSKIFSERSKEFIPINPPKDKLVLHVRRDEKEYPFLEDLINWSSSVKGFRFATEGGTIEFVDAIENLESLNALPSVLEQVDSKTLSEIIEDFNSLGYSIENTKVDSVTGKPMDFKIVYIKEEGVKNWIRQNDMSQGMFRAFALLSIVHYFTKMDNKNNELILVDDLCEGLDYERATKFARLLFKKLAEFKNIQLICTTNDNFLMNTVDTKHWNILSRKGNKVHAKNYHNNKEVFDNFRLSGLNNFDLLSSDYFKELK